VLLDKVADDREISVDNQELTMLIYRKAQENGTTPEQELSHMQEHDHMGEWVGEIRRGKALGLIVAGATITDADGKAVDLSRLNADGTLNEDEAPTEAPASEEAAGQDAQAEAQEGSGADLRRGRRRHQGEAGHVGRRGVNPLSHRSPRTFR